MHNQFETPILFFALLAIATFVGATVLMVTLAWSYFATRVVHTAIHTTGTTCLAASMHSSPAHSPRRDVDRSSSRSSVAR